MTDESLLEQVWRSLDEVLDPCSIGVGSAMSVRQLGLIEEVTVRNGEVQVVMCVTAPVCLMVSPMLDAIESSVRALPGVKAVEARLDPTILWARDRMSDSSGAEIAEGRRVWLERGPVAPQEWRTRAQAVSS